MFKFDSLKILHQDMLGNNETRALFPFTYNERDFSCIFLTDISPMRLYLSTLGDTPITFELQIDGNYCTRTYIEDYRTLVHYLDLRYNPNNRFKPVDFFRVLNDNIPNQFNIAPNNSEVIRVVANRRDIEEQDRIYFCGWRINPPGTHVSDANLEKTRSAFGDDVADMCSCKNISSRWTATANEEDLARLNEIHTF